MVWWKSSIAHLRHLHTEGRMDGRTTPTTCQSKECRDHSVASRLRKSHEKGEYHGRSVVNEHLYDNDCDDDGGDDNNVENRSKVKGHTREYSWVSVRGLLLTWIMMYL